MKNLIFAIALFIGLTGTINAQTSSQEEQKEKAKTELRDHTCTDACKTAGECVIAHGEKGHTCDATCKTMESTKCNTKEAAKAKKCCSKTKAKDCSASSKKGTENPAHGEKGHACTESCKMVK